MSKNRSLKKVMKVKQVMKAKPKAGRAGTNAKSVGSMKTVAAGTMKVGRPKKNAGTTATSSTMKVGRPKKNHGVMKKKIIAMKKMMKVKPPKAMRSVAVQTNDNYNYQHQQLYAPMIADQSYDQQNHHQNENHFHQNQPSYENAPTNHHYQNHGLYAQHIPYPHINSPGQNRMQAQINQMVYGNPPDENLRVKVEIDGTQYGDQNQAVKEEPDQMPYGDQGVKAETSGMTYGNQNENDPAQSSQQTGQPQAPRDGSPMYREEQPRRLLGYFYIPTDGAATGVFVPYEYAV